MIDLDELRYGVSEILLWSHRADVTTLGLDLGESYVLLINSSTVGS